jgi:hypothetical protein
MSANAISHPFLVFEDVMSISDSEVDTSNYAVKIYKASLFD